MWIVFLILIIPCTSLYSQQSAISISGIISDSLSGETLIGATITISKENNPIDNPSEDIDWDYPSEKIIAKYISLGNSYVDVYGTTVHNDETIHYRGYAKILEGGEIDLDNVIEVEIDDSWEPSDDQMMNRGNYEGGIRYGDGDKWQGR